MKPMLGEVSAVLRLIPFIYDPRCNDLCSYMQEGSYVVIGSKSCAFKNHSTRQAKEIPAVTLVSVMTFANYSEAIDKDRVSEKLSDRTEDEIRLRNRAGVCGDPIGRFCRRLLAPTSRRA